MNYLAFFLVTSDNHSFTMEITEETIITESKKKKKKKKTLLNGGSNDGAFQPLKSNILPQF